MTAKAAEQKAASDGLQLLEVAMAQLDSDGATLKRCDGSTVGFCRCFFLLTDGVFLDGLFKCLINV